MNFEIYLDPTHKILGLTFVSPILDLKGVEEMYSHLKDITSQGGPYAVIHDFSAVTGTTLSVNQIKEHARFEAPLPLGRPMVVVVKEPHIFGLTKLFTTWCENFRAKGMVLPGWRFDVVSTMEEAYELLGARPDDFTIHVCP